uniref:Glycosyltransferase n=1 Tax=Polygala tenuifolia TaxID=355332 RepID=A0A3G3NC71_9FABA|nr:UDP-glucosyltransferase UGT71AD1 [Polygala tenuifolia]
MKKLELVFIPFPAIGHLVSTIELAKLLLGRDDRFSITFFLMKPAFGPSHSTQSFSSSYPQIRFIDIPRIDPPPADLFRKSFEKVTSMYIESYKASVKEAVVNHVLPNCDKFAGLVVDIFCTSMIDVANELGVPSYLYFTSGAGFLGFLLHLSTRHDQGVAEFEKSDPDSFIPCYINPVPTDVLPSFAFNKEGGYAAFLNHARRFKETKGILVNTFPELEPHAVSSLSVYNDLPKVYTVGPLISHKSQSPWQSHQEKYDKIMKWLDDQPPSSVVFLCFGSWGCFSESQLKEIAIALEKSGHRFLWSIRAAGKDELGTPVENINYGEILPEGFLERTQDKAFLCGWTPQVEVLAHKAVGCFVSHCGWNSILESVWYGVPIVTWPIYAEQQLNAFQMVKDLRLAVEMKLDYRRGTDTIVKADEIAKAVSCAMEEDGEVKKKVKDVSEKSRETVVEGGSSCASVRMLVEAMVEGST